MKIIADLSLVTGANGHLGNNLVRALLGKGEGVRAGGRNSAKVKPFEGLGCEVVHTDLADKTSLFGALEGVETLYQVAAVFRHWSRDAEREIIRPNLEGTRNVLEVAAESGVKRVVYVSSIAALDKSSPYIKGPFDESTWNTNYYGNPYYRSKVESEKLALGLARELGLELVSVLPSTIVGPNCFRLTPSMNVLERVLGGDLPVDPNFRFNFVDARDVAEGMISAAEKGCAGERYILAGDESMSIPRMVEIAREFSPGLRIPPQVPKPVLLAAASAMELGGRLTGREPMILRSQVRMYYGTEQEFAIDKAERELGYAPRSSEEAVRECFRYLGEVAGERAA